MTLSLIVEIALSTLLAATLICCAILERRLSMLRKGQDGLKQIIAELNGGIVSAGASVSALKESAATAAQTLDERFGKARAMADELSMLTASGERIAERMVANRAPSPPAVANAVLAGRLQALRTEALRNVR